MKRKILLAVMFVGLALALTVHHAPATTTWIKDLSNFPAYPYNTGTYWTPSLGYVGCGPTTGAMIFGYFQNEYGAANLLTPPTPAGTDQGLQTAKVLHGSAYMQTGLNGFGSVLRIEPGLEQYAQDRGYIVDALIHVSPPPPPPQPVKKNKMIIIGSMRNNLSISNSFFTITTRALLCSYPRCQCFMM